MKTLAALAAICLLTACGQTGPLKQPQPKPTASTPPATAPADAQKPQSSPSP